MKQIRPHVLALLATVSTVSIAHLVAAQPYRYVITEMPASGGYSVAYSLRRDGSVVGLVEAGGATQAFVWKPVSDNSPVGSQMMLAQVGGGTYSGASSISDTGLIAGYAVDGNGNRSLTKWDYDSGVAVPLVPIIGIPGIGLGINDAGQIAFNSDGTPRVYSSGTVSLLHCSWGGATAINEFGDIVGGSNSGLIGSYQGTLWRAGSYATEDNLGLLFGGQFTDAGSLYAINSQRRCTGYATMNGTPQAILWDYGAAAPVNISPNAMECTGYGINQQGEIVGRYSILLGQAYSPFLWTNGIFCDLQSEIDPTSGWNLQQAYDINEFGQICGFGYLDGQPRGYLLTPVPQNQPPNATNDFYVIAQASTLSVPSPGVQANDSDPDEDPLTASLMSGPAHAASFTFNQDGSFSYAPHPYFFGTDTFTYRVNDGSEDSNVATVSITVNQPGAGGFITGGGKFYDGGNKRTFGFVAKVLQGAAQGNLEFQDHDTGLNVKSSTVDWVYSPNATDGYFSGSCKVNGEAGYTFFVQVHDRGEPGRNDDFTIWVFNSFGFLSYLSTGQLSNGGNIQIHN